jgi:hypothetical protein
MEAAVGIDVPIDKWRDASQVLSTKAAGPGRFGQNLLNHESVNVNSKTPTKIHFDIHRNVLYFTNTKELRSKLKGALDKNRDLLFASKDAE